MRYTDLVIISLKRFLIIERFSETSNAWFELLSLNFDDVTKHDELYIDKTN